MNVSIGKEQEAFVASVVEQGRYGSASDVVREGLLLLEQQEAKLAALKARIEAAIAEGGSYTDAEIEAAIDAEAAKYEAASASAESV